ncbi:MAG TPA: ABC transporter substrate-binding protein [Limnochordia bacterium]|nr:ABC transporter substrate-binding protein [Limnochordia bacterium]
MKGTKGILAVALLATLLFGGVSSAATTITFWHDWGGENGEILQDIVSRFEALNPDIDVEVQLTSDLSQKLLVAIMGGVAPDVVLLDRWMTSSLAAQGGLTVLDPLIERDQVYPEDYFPPTWEEATFRGHSYGIPFNTDTRALFYHEGMFLEAGLDPNDPPSTWEDLRLNASKVTRRNPDGSLRQVGYVPHWGQPNIVHYLMQNGGSVFNEDQTLVTFHDERGIEALEWMVDFVDFYGGVTVLDEFAATIQVSGPIPAVLGGFQAIHYDGNWNLGALRREFRDFYDTQLRAALPPGNRQRATLSGGFALAIPRGITEERLEAAWRFIRYMTGFDAQLDMAVRTGNIPALIEAATDSRYVDDEIRAVFVEAVQYAWFRPNHPSYPRIDEILRVQVQTAALNKEMSPRAALEEAARQAQAILDEVNGLIRHLNPE